MFKYILSILVCLMAGFIGSFFTSPAIQGWYANVTKPSFNPPNWIFAPMWTLLFILMGIAVALVLSKGWSVPSVKIAVILFGVHLILNVLWSVFFFGMQNPALAFVEIIILWLMIALLIFLFFKIDMRAGWLMIPYILWVSFAAILNFAIWRLN